jgi:hypothetical protein
MSWNVEYTDEFGQWWNKLSEAEQESVAASVGLLEQFGPQLPFPHSSGLERSKHGHMRASFAFSMRDALIGCSTLSIRVASQSCSSGATRRGTIAGMSSSFRWQIGSTMRTLFC